MMNQTNQLGEQGVQFDTQELPISNNTITPEPCLEACYKTHQQFESPILTNQIKKRNQFQNCRSVATSRCSHWNIKRYSPQHSESPNATNRLKERNQFQDFHHNTLRYSLTF